MTRLKVIFYNLHSYKCNQISCLFTSIPFATYQDAVTSLVKSVGFFLERSCHDLYDYECVLLKFVTSVGKGG